VGAPRGSNPSFAFRRRGTRPRTQRRMGRRRDRRRQAAPTRRRRPPGRPARGRRRQPRERWLAGGGRRPGSARRVWHRGGPRHVRTHPGRGEAAQVELGCTVVVKVAAAIHKSDVGGVRLGVTTPAAAADAVRAIRADLESAGIDRGGQRAPRAGASRIGAGDDRGCQPRPPARVARDGRSGWQARRGAGDVAVRIAPLTDDDIEDMLQSLKSYRLLTGYGGARSRRRRVAPSASPGLCTCR